MSAAGSSEEQFLCSICLEVFSEPVSTPCGHNFCKRCICQTWDTHVCCKCPLCNRSFSTRPELFVNTLLSEMVSQWKLEAKRWSQKVSKPGDVSCDFCSGPKLKAVKSCLVCLSSFCESHLQPHLTESELKGHQLMEPVDDLEDRMCPKHQRPLELFCGTDQSCVCTMCIVLEHKNHEYVSLEEACEHRRASLLLSQAQSQHMVEQRRLKVQEIQRCLELSQTKAQKEIQEMVEAFSVVVQSVQRHLNRHTKLIEQTQNKLQNEAQALLSELQRELCELEKNCTEAQQLSLSTDPIHFLQHCPALPPTGLKEWSSMSFEPQTCEGSAALALSELENTLSQKFKQLASTLELRRVQTFAVDVTLDPDTAHPSLVLSEDLKRVHCGDMKKNLPDFPQRFDGCVNVLGKQSFSSGRFYFEVQVKGKTWWNLGVARESINRKGQSTYSPQNGYWTIALTNKDRYRAYVDTPVCLHLQKPPQKVGVFVDYKAGLVSFYDVDSADLLYTFTGCSFRGKLLPLFNPWLNDGGKNSAPLIITDVQTE